MATLYPETEATVNKILQGYANTRFQILVSPTQAGKTSVYTHTANKMLQQCTIKRVYVLSGMDNVELCNQTEVRLRKVIPSTVELNVWFRSTLKSKIDNRRNDDNIYSSTVYVDLAKRFCNSLVIIDESHFGSGKDDILDKFLRMIGIGANGTLDKWHLETNTYVLTVSATPYAEVSAITHTNTSSTKGVVVHIPGPTYRSLNHLDIIKIRHGEEHEQLVEALGALVQTKTYAIVRAIIGSYTMNAVREVCNIYGDKVEAIQCDHSTGKSVNSIIQNGIHPTDDEYSVAPSKFTILMVKQYCSAGVTVPKKHISMVWETHPHADSITQGLPGRMTGYCDYLCNGKKVQVYCHKDIIDSHIRWYKYTLDSPTTSGRYIPATGTHVKPNRRLGRSRIISSDCQKGPTAYRTPDEVRNALSYYGYKKMPTFDYHGNDGHLTQQQLRTDDGLFIRQYLPKYGTGIHNLTVLGYDDLKNYLTNDYFLLNATKADSNGIVSAKVAKIAYTDLSDPSSMVYVLYAYHGKVDYVDHNEFNTNGKVTDDSMYISTYNHAAISTSKVVVYSIPDNVATSNDGIRQYVESMFEVSKSGLFILNSTQRYDPCAGNRKNAIELQILDRMASTLSIHVHCYDLHIRDIVHSTVDSMWNSKESVPVFHKQTDLVLYLVRMVCNNEPLTAKQILSTKLYASIYKVYKDRWRRDLDKIVTSTLTSCPGIKKTKHKTSNANAYQVQCVE